MDRSAYARFAAFAALCLISSCMPSMATGAPASAWLEAEQARFTRVMGAAKADVLIVPFQVSGPGFDPAERLLMAAQLGDALAAGIRLTPLPVPLSRRASAANSSR